MWNCQILTVMLKRDKNLKAGIRNWEVPIVHVWYNSSSCAIASTLPAAVLGPQLSSLGYWSFNTVSQMRHPAHPYSFGYLLVLLVSQRSMPLDCKRSWREPTQTRGEHANSTAPRGHPTPSGLSWLVLYSYEFKSWFCDWETTTLNWFLLCLYWVNCY